MRGKPGFKGNQPGFSIHFNKGFHITFPNDVTVSVQFGGGNYCENYDVPIDSSITEGMEAADAEIAVWDKDGTWYVVPDADGEVLGYQSAQDVLEILKWASELHREDME